MADFAGKFVSSRQDWPTPDGMWRSLDDEFHFTIDLAADHSNAKTPKFFSSEENALTQDWLGVGWLNPPYGGTASNKLQAWVQKAAEESARHGSTVVMLIPARTNTVWWHRFCMTAAEVRFICGRPKFGDAEHGLPQPLALIVFAPHHGGTRFSSLFVHTGAHGLGEVEPNA